MVATFRKWLNEHYMIGEGRFLPVSFIDTCSRSSLKAVISNRSHRRLELRLAIYDHLPLFVRWPARFKVYRTKSIKRFGPNEGDRINQKVLNRFLVGLCRDPKGLQKQKPATFEYTVTRGSEDIGRRRSIRVFTASDYRRRIGSQCKVLRSIS